MPYLGAEFQASQREAEARALGAELYQYAASISDETVDAVAAVLTAVASTSRGQLADEMSREFARQIIWDSAVRHRERVQQGTAQSIAD